MLNPKNFEFGRNFVWFAGVVEDRNDPNYLGRVRVRCYGFHTDDRFELPTEDLPWAMVMQSVNSAAQTEVGQSPTGLVDGSWVIGFFLDGEEAQQPLVIGSLGGYATKPEHLDDAQWARHGFKDVRENSDMTRKGFPRPPIKVEKRKGELGSEIVEDPFVERYPRREEQQNTTTPRLARGIADERNFHDLETSLNTSMAKESILFKEPLSSKINNENKSISTAKKLFSYDQPTSPYNAVYPFNHVQQTESGHVIEYDDTPNAERIHEYHRSGTFREIHPSGKSVTQIMDEKYDLVESNSYEYVKGSKYETYKRGYYQLINDSEAGGVEARVEVAGAANYILNVNNGNYECQVSNGYADIFAKQIIKLRSNEILQEANLFRLYVGNYELGIKNDITFNSRMFQTSTGSHHATTIGNYSIEAGDNYQMKAQHTATIIAENSWLNPLQYPPEPIAIHQIARTGNIVINAQDGDTKIASKSVIGIYDKASLTVTSPLPKSIVSLEQLQPTPEKETHNSHPGSIIAQTTSGYIYMLSTFGNIVLDAKGLTNSIKLKTLPGGKIDAIGGNVQITATSEDVSITSTFDTTVDARGGIRTQSGQATEINSHTQVFVKAGTNLEIEAFAEASLTSKVGGVRLGDKNTQEPAIKGESFRRVFLRHTHLTPMGPTGPVNQVTDPSIAADIFNSFCTKTFVF